MSEHKHTPGPWFVGHGDVYAEGNKASDFDDRVICAIGRGGERSHEYATVPAHKPEGRANARLIAAAPMLLEALQGLLADVKIAQVNMRYAARHDLRWDGCAEAIQPRVDIALAAIAAATGDA